MAPMHSRLYYMNPSERMDEQLLPQQPIQTDYIHAPEVNSNRPYQCTHCKAFYKDLGAIRRHVGAGSAAGENYHYNPKSGICRAMVLNKRVIDDDVAVVQGAAGGGAEQVPFQVLDGDFEFIRFDPLMGKQMYKCCHCPPSSSSKEYSGLLSLKNHLRCCQTRLAKKVNDQQHDDEGGMSDDDAVGSAYDSGGEDILGDQENVAVAAAADDDEPVANLGFIPTLIRECGADAYAREITGFIEKVYGKGAMGADTFELFLRACRGFEFKPQDELRIQLLEFDAMVKGGGVGREAGDYLLKILRELQSKVGATMSIDIPKHWQSVTDFVKTEKQTLNGREHISIQAEFPASWHMDLWAQTEGGPPPGPILRIRDPLRVLAFLVNDPAIVFGNSEHLGFLPKEVLREDKDGVKTRRQGNLNESKWFKEAYEKIRLKDPYGILAPFFAYMDGVAMAWGMMAVAEAVMCTFGFFSDELQRRDLSKVVLGFIDQPGTTDMMLKAHLMSLPGELKMSATRAEEELKHYKRQLMQQFMEVVTDHLQYGWDHGVEIPLLGPGLVFDEGTDHAVTKKQVKFYTCLVALVGDDPALNRQVGVYEGNPNRGCRTCLFRIGDVRPFVDGPDCLWEKRTTVGLADKAKTAFEGKKKPAVQRTAQERQAINELEEACIHAEFNAFHNAPFGGGDNCHSFAMSPSDLFHLFCAGLQKALLSWILIIITLIAKAQDNQFKGGPAEFDANICQLGRLPEMAHVASNVTFSKGIISIIEGRTKEEMAGGSASFGGKFRSAEYTNALLLSFVARAFRALYTRVVSNKNPPLCIEKPFTADGRAKKKIKASAVLPVPPAPPGGEAAVLVVPPVARRISYESLRNALKPVEETGSLPPDIGDVLYRPYLEALAAWDGNDASQFDLEEGGLILAFYALAHSLGFYEFPDLEFQVIPESLMSLSDLSFLYCMISAAHLYEKNAEFLANNPDFALGNNSKKIQVKVEDSGSTDLINWMFPKTYLTRRRAAKALVNALRKEDGQMMTREEADILLVKKQKLYKFYFGAWGIEAGHPRYSTPTDDEKKEAARRGGNGKKKRPHRIIDIDEDQENDPLLLNRQAPVLDEDGMDLLRRTGCNFLW